jgi:glucose/arabinose transport system permease protein
LIWLWLFNPQIGIDWVLTSLHLPTIPWLVTPTATYIALIIVEVWAYTGLATLFYLASFLSVDRSIIEAARLDGATGIGLLFRILLPNSMSGFIVATALLFLFSFRIFDIPFIMSGSATSLTFNDLGHVHILPLCICRELLSSRGISNLGGRYSCCGYNTLFITWIKEVGL